MEQPVLCKIPSLLTLYSKVYEFSNWKSIFVFAGSRSPHWSVYNEFIQYIGWPGHCLDLQLEDDAGHSGVRTLPDGWRVSTDADVARGCWEKQGSSGSSRKGIYIYYQFGF